MEQRDLPRAIGGRAHRIVARWVDCDVGDRRRVQRHLGRLGPLLVEGTGEGGDAGSR